MASLKLNLGTTGHDHTESADTKVTIDFALPDGSSYSLQTKKDATVEFLKSALDKEKGLPFAKTVTTSHVNPTDGIRHCLTRERRCWIPSLSSMSFPIWEAL